MGGVLGECGAASRAKDWDQAFVVGHLALLPVFFSTSYPCQAVRSFHQCPATLDWLSTTPSRA